MKNNIEIINKINKELLDSNDWKEYIISDLFEIFTGNEKQKINSIGKISLLSTGTKNNGLIEYVGLKKDKPIIGEGISVSNIDSNAIFFQSGKFYLTQNVFFLKPIINLNKNQLLFIIPLIKKNLYGYGWGNYIGKDGLSNLIIKLPSKLNIENNKYEINFEYIDNYIQNLTQTLEIYKIKEKVNKIININKEFINVNNWKEYKISDLFEIIRGKRLRSVDRLKGKLRYFSSTSENNGVSDYISNPLFIENNALIFNTFGNVFYCDDIFSGSDEITILKNKNLNKYIGIYLSTIMTKAFDKKFGYEKKAFYNEIIKEKIILPSKLNIKINEYEPDWEYMENYIKNLNI